MHLGQDNDEQDSGVAKAWFCPEISESLDKIHDIDQKLCAQLVFALVDTLAAGSVHGEA